jgi:hypothetical protein
MKIIFNLGDISIATLFCVSSFFVGLGTVGVTHISPTPRIVWWSFLYLFFVFIQEYEVKYLAKFHQNILDMFYGWFPQIIMISYFFGVFVGFMFIWHYTGVLFHM